MPMSILDTITSPYSVKYWVAANDTGTQSRTQAQMIADCAQGPLRSLLGRLTASQFTNLDVDTRVRIVVTPKGNAASVRASFLSGSLVMQGSAACDATVTVSCAHSIDT